MENAGKNGNGGRAATVGACPEVTPPAEKPPIFAMMERFGKWNQKVRVLAWVKKAIKKWKVYRRNRQGNSLSGLQLINIREAENCLLKAIQASQFSPEITVLRDGEIFSPQYRLSPKLKMSKIRKWNVFLDKDGLMRSGTRLINAQSLLYDQKFPIVLPKKDQNVQTIILDTHVRYGHIGIEQTRGILRRRFAIIDDGQVIRKVIHQCVTCQKLFKKPMEQKMAPLPLERIEMGNPFEITGIDLFGPYNVSNGRRRRLKIWGIIFTCLKIRAVHFEVVESLSAPAFLTALIRFQAQYPGVKVLYSDCGTNFVGAEKIIQSAVENSTMVGGMAPSLITPIERLHLPPHAPHRGGVWERLIRSTKKIPLFWVRAMCPTKSFERCCHNRPL